MIGTTLQLGHKMRDRVSGFEGIAEVRTDFLNGNVQFSLQPAFDPKSKVGQSARSFDAFQLVTVSHAMDFIPAPADTGIVLGEKVKDMVSNVEGIAVSRSTFLNGCVYYTVTFDASKEPDKLTEFFFDYARLKRVSAGVVKELQARREGQPVTGGPSYRVPQRS